MQRKGPGGHIQHLAAEVTSAGTAFDVVGVTFDGAAQAGLDIQVRVRTSGSWSTWPDLEVDADEDPDPGTPEAQRSRGGTAPLAASGADGAEVRGWSDDGSALPT